jgi:hypothetical protein
MPFRGKPMPKSLAVWPGDLSEEQEAYWRGRELEAAQKPKRRPSLRLIQAYCRQCQPGDRTDCGADDCPLYPFRPWEGPGKAARRKPTPKQLAHWKRLADGPASFRNRRMQKGSTAGERAPNG